MTNHGPSLPLYPTPSGDHAGYCTLVETWGSDEQVIASARMSTDGAFRGWGHDCEACDGSGFTGNLLLSHPPQKQTCPTCKGEGKVAGDEKLLRYLWTNGHSTPFEMAGATLEIQVPIFVIRQVHRHRTLSYNELSARYTEMPDLFWLPRSEDVRAQGGASKQGSVTPEGEVWGMKSAEAVRLLLLSYEDARRTYEQLMGMGVAREQARAVLPVAQMTRCRVSGNLSNLLRFVKLRTGAHAQAETRVLAEAMATHLRGAFPRTLALFDASR